MQRARKAFTALAAIVALAALSVAASGAAAATVFIGPSSSDWFFFNEGASGSGAYVSGPTGATGAGSAELAVDLTGRENLGTVAYAGTKLGDLTTLTYRSYRSSPNPGNVLAVSLQLDVDYDLNDANTAWQGRLVFEPYQTVGNTIAQNTWYTWDALAGKWWASGSPGSGICPQSSPCTWSQVLDAFPNAGLRAGAGLLQFRAGGPWSDGFTGNVDDLTVGVSGAATTRYDFEPACDTTTSGSTITLESDCTVDHTFVVPNGMTLDGAGHTITAIDPSPDHFRGAVVASGGTSANVTNLTVTASRLADVCDGGADRLRGILFDGAGGSITNVTVHGVRQGHSGCQEGNAIEVRNFDASGNPGSSRVVVTIGGNVVSDYQKNGITANGGVAATITSNTVTGDGPVDYTAQNGIQVGFGATALVQGNTVSGNWYTPDSFTACGLLFFDAAGVKQRQNTLLGNEQNVCNVGRGGGRFKGTG